MVKSSLACFEDHSESMAPDLANVICDRCRCAELAQGKIRAAFWVGDRIMIVDNIPGLVCNMCGEEFVGPAAADGLDRLKSRCGEAEVISQMIVPVFDFATFKPLSN